MPIAKIHLESFQTPRSHLTEDINLAIAVAQHPGTARIMRDVLSRPQSGLARRWASRYPGATQTVYLITSAQAQQKAA